MLKPYYEEPGITIYCDDCRNVLPHLPKVDLVLTDPPYGIARVMKGGKGTGHWTLLSAGNPWDHQAPDISFLHEHYNVAVIWGGNYFDLPLSRCWFVWNKLNAVNTMGQCELAWTSMDRPIQKLNYPVGRVVYGHPTEKPYEVIKWSVEESRTSGTILDPYMGSGTTLVAAKQLGRKAIGIEIEKKYCDIAIDRLRQEVLPLNQPERKPPEQVALGDCPHGPIDYDITLEEAGKGHCFDEMWGVKK